MRKKQIELMALTALGLAVVSACGESAVESGAITDDAVGHKAPAVTFEPSGKELPSATPAGPVSISYRIVGEPVVGQPVAIDLRVSSSLRSQPIRLAYGIKDASAMSLAESQPGTVNLPAPVDEATATSQVRIVPLREGRFYLNVSASFDTSAGSVSTVTAIPIQVGEGRRDLQSNGTLQTDGEGESVRVLPATEN